MHDPALQHVVRCVSTGVCRPGFWRFILSSESHGTLSCRGRCLQNIRSEHALCFLARSGLTQP